MTERKPRSQPKPSKTDPAQSAEFIRVARELGCEENFAQFEAALPRILRTRPKGAKAPAHPSEAADPEKG